MHQRVDEARAREMFGQWQKAAKEIMEDPRAYVVVFSPDRSEVNPPMYPAFIAGLRESYDERICEISRFEDIPYLIKPDCQRTLNPRRQYIAVKDKGLVGVFAWGEYFGACVHQIAEEFRRRNGLDRGQVKVIVDLCTDCAGYSAYMLDSADKTRRQVDSEFELVTSIEYPRPVEPIKTRFPYARAQKFDKRKVKKTKPVEERKEEDYALPEPQAQETVSGCADAIVTGLLTGMAAPASNSIQIDQQSLAVSTVASNI